MIEAGTPTFYSTVALRPTLPFKVMALPVHHQPAVLSLGPCSPAVGVVVLQIFASYSCSCPCACAGPRSPAVAVVVLQIFALYSCSCPCARPRSPAQIYVPVQDLGVLQMPLCRTSGSALQYWHSGYEGYGGEADLQMIVDQIQPEKSLYRALLLLWVWFWC